MVGDNERDQKGPRKSDPPDINPILGLMFLGKPYNILNSSRLISAGYDFDLQLGMAATIHKPKTEQLAKNSEVVVTHVENPTWAVLRSPAKSLTFSGLNGNPH